MTVPLDAAATARINARVRGAIWLVDLAFSTGTVHYTNAPVNLTIGGNFYYGFYSVIDISAINESEANSAEKLTLGFSIVNQAMLALTLGSVDTYRGRAVRLSLQLMDERFQPDGAPILRWSGYMDKVQIPRQRSPATGGASGGKIELLCSRAGMARARNYRGRRLTSTQQQQRFPGDLGLQYMQHLVEQPARWLSKKFQEI